MRLKKYANANGATRAVASQRVNGCQKLEVRRRNKSGSATGKGAVFRTGREGMVNA